MNTHSRKNLFAALATLLLAINLQAQPGDPTPTPSPTPDPDAPDRTQVICGGTMSFVSAQFGATRDSNIGNIFKLVPVAGAQDKRAVVSGVVTLQDNHEFAFTTTLLPNSSRLVSGEDSLTMTVRYQRRDGDKVKVLAEGIATSDELSSFAELNARRIDLTVHQNFTNPEVSTVLANAGHASTVEEAVRSGQLPDGVTTNGSFNCRMHVGHNVFAPIR